jgi:hypothetical protein
MHTSSTFLRNCARQHSVQFEVITGCDSCFAVSVTTISRTTGWPLLGTFVKSDNSNLGGAGERLGAAADLLSARGLKLRAD